MPQFGVSVLRYSLIYIYLVSCFSTIIKISCVPYSWLELHILYLSHSLVHFLGLSILVFWHFLADFIFHFNFIYFVVLLIQSKRLQFICMYFNQLNVLLFNVRESLKWLSFTKKPMVKEDNNTASMENNKQSPRKKKIPVQGKCWVFFFIEYSRPTRQRHIFHSYLTSLVYLSLQTHALWLSFIDICVHFRTINTSATVWM